MTKFQKIIFCFCCIFCIGQYTAYADTVRFAVGHDHQLMMDRKYDIYISNWEAIEQSLTDLGHDLEAFPLPWARAKAKVQAGELDGLFIAAKFLKRDKWAAFSHPIGFEIYGAFENNVKGENSHIAAAVRLGGMDRILSNVPAENLLYVPTAQKGLQLLHQQKVGQFLMAQGYGTYLLNNELQHISSNITFNPVNSESRSLHIAVSKHHDNSLAKLDIINQAIDLSFKKGYYQQAMNKYKVPQAMRIKNNNKYDKNND